MANDLTQMDSSTPTGSDKLSIGDDEIRAVKAQVLASFSDEHSLNGKHKISTGSTGNRPTATATGQIYINTDTTPATLEYWDGSDWTVIADVNTLATHIAASPIDHPDGSITAVKLADDAITADKITAGTILKKHLDGSTDATSIAALVEGSDADSLHTHGSNTSARYTPTLTAGDNINVLDSAVSCHYSRQGNIVSVAGSLSCSLNSSGGGLSSVFVTLPVASILTTTVDVAGTSVSGDSGIRMSGRVYGDVSTASAKVEWAQADSIATVTHGFMFMYEVI